MRPRQAPAAPYDPARILKEGVRWLDKKAVYLAAPYDPARILKEEELVVETKLAQACSPLRSGEDTESVIWLKLAADAEPQPCSPLRSGEDTESATTPVVRHSGDRSPAVPYDPARILKGKGKGEVRTLDLRAACSPLRSGEDTESIIGGEVVFRRFGMPAVPYDPARILKDCSAIALAKPG